MDFFEMDKVLVQLIKQKPNLNTGFNFLRQTLSNNEEWDSEEIENIDINSVYSEFEKWLKGLLLKDPPSADIVAFNFGLFESSEGIQMYISGSTEFDEEDSDWACNNDYFPEDRYPEIPGFEVISKLLEDDVMLGIFVAVGITALVVQNFIEKHGSTLLRDTDSVYLATGFDDGDLYNLYKLTKAGVEALG